MSGFSNIFGFERADVGLHNWREAPYNGWAFQNVDELLHTSIIASGTTSAPLDEAVTNDLLTADFGTEVIEDFLVRSNTESFLVSKAGKLVTDWQAGHTSPEKPHIVFSISKSITALVAGILQDRGSFDPQQTVGHYMPEAINSGFGDCPLQHLLDMRVSLAFTEDYLDTQGDFARYRRATGWNPPEPGQEPGQEGEGLATFLFSLAKGDGPHGGKFNYLSPNTDLLGLILERVSGTSYADLVSELLWQPLGAESDAIIGLDGHGAPRAAGGLCVTARDLLRLGHLILNGGAAGSTQIISESWLADMRNNGDRDAWMNGDFAAMMGPGRYRNKWYQLGPDSRQIAAIGIHGQWLFIDPRTGVVIVKQSSQPIPLDEALEQQCLELCGQISEMI